MFMFFLAVKCSLIDGRKFSHGDNVTIAAASDYQVPQSADVVFVMSHGECNREVTERIGNMVNLLERGMQVRTTTAASSVRLTQVNTKICLTTDDYIILNFKLYLS